MHALIFFSIFARIMESLLGKTLEELHDVATQVGLPAFAAKQLAQWLYVRGVAEIDEMTNISLAARERLKQIYQIGRTRPVESQCSTDGTVKYLYRTENDHFIETVFIPESDRATLCVSSQVGCKMGCRFCMTGRQGFNGQLSATDILNQIYSLPERDRLTNIVFMGQGEPFDNLEQVLRATDLLMAPYGWAWSPKRITVSTVGLRKGMERFLRESPCHLAVSLHNPFPEERSEMMPAERAYSLSEFLPLLSREDWSHQRRLSFEYIVFRGLNDTSRHARELARLLAPLHCRVNLIRFHSIPDSPFQGADEQTMVWLRDYLTRHGVTTTIRQSRGEDIMAACGLLSTTRMEN